MTARTTTVSGLELRLHEPADGRPTGPPLLFVHGAWHGAWCWDEHMLAWFAAAGWQALALSLRHHGASAAPASLRRVSLADYADDVATVAATLDELPILIGHSMGGAVVQRCLSRGVPMTGAVLVASAPPHGIIRTALRVARTSPAAFVKANATLRLQPLVATPELTDQFLFGGRLHQADLDAYTRRLGDESYRAFLDMLVPHKVDHPGVPVRVIGAARDRLFSPRDIERTAAAFSTEPRFVDCAHDVMLDPNWEAVAAAIAAFCESMT